MSIDKDYYKTRKTSSSFDSNYVECQTKGDKDKTLSIKENFHTIFKRYSK